MIQQTKMPFIKPINHRRWVIAAMVVFTCLVGFQDMYAQDFGDIGGGQDTGGIDQLQQLQQSQVGGGTAGTGGDGGSTNELETFSADDAVLSDISTDDVRNQGFVGATGTRIQSLGFVGPAGELSGPPLAEGASFGGGVNDSAAGGSSFGGGNAGRNQQTGFGAFGGQGKGFQVIRKGVRTSLKPRFASPTYSTGEISNRFNNRIRRQPVIQNDGGGLVVSISNRVATVSGYAQTEAERNRFIRQLRLEPGIDHINDQTNRQ